MHSFTEENYLKTIYQLGRKQKGGVNTTAIAERLETKASSVTDMIKRLADKELVHYKKYQGVTLTDKGRRIAIEIIRKHRLWEVFLVERLDFKWDEVHDIAEQLEHVQSEELTVRLDKYLGYPKYDPHGDPIPDSRGNIDHHHDFSLADLKQSEEGIIMGVKDSSAEFLQYLENNNLVLGRKIKVQQIESYDKSVLIEVNGDKVSVSHQVSKNLYVKKLK